MCVLNVYFERTNGGMYVVGIDDKISAAKDTTELSNKLYDILAPTNDTNLILVEYDEGHDGYTAHGSNWMSGWFNSPYWLIEFLKWAYGRNGSSCGEKNLDDSMKKYAPYRYTVYKPYNIDTSSSTNDFVCETHSGEPHILRQDKPINFVSKFEDGDDIDIDINLGDDNDDSKYVEEEDINADKKYGKRQYPERPATLSECREFYVERLREMTERLEGIREVSEYYQQKYHQLQKDYDTLVRVHDKMLSESDNDTFFDNGDANTLNLHVIDDFLSVQEVKDIDIHTISASYMDNLLRERRQSNRFAMCKADGVDGLFIFNDGESDNLGFKKINDEKAMFDENITSFSNINGHGVFLPLNGYRKHGVDFTFNKGDAGYYLLDDGKSVLIITSMKVMITDSSILNDRKVNYIF